MVSSEFSSNRPDHRRRRCAGPKRCLSLEHWILPDHSFQSRKVVGPEYDWKRDFRVPQRKTGAYGRTWMQIAKTAQVDHVPLEHRNHNHRFELNHRTQSKKSEPLATLGRTAESRADLIQSTCTRWGRPTSKVLPSGRARQRAEGGRAGACGGDSC